MTTDDGIVVYNGTGDKSWYRADINKEGTVTEYKTTSTLEDTNGEKRTLDGMAKGCAGKVAMLLVYKGQNADPIASQIEYAAQTTIKEDGSYHFDYVTKEEEIKPLLEKQVSSSVRWQQTIERLIADGADKFVEIGPGKTLTGFMRKINRDVAAVNIDKYEDFEKFVAESKNK